MVELLGKDVKAAITKYILDFQISMSMQSLWQKLLTECHSLKGSSVAAQMRASKARGQSTTDTWRLPPTAGSIFRTERITIRELQNSTKTPFKNKSSHFRRQF